MHRLIEKTQTQRKPQQFTVKNLVASSDTAATSIDAGLKMSGKFVVPSYRTGLFLDPKGRGTTTGYDQAVALPAMQAGGDEGMFKENNKKFDVLDGSIEFKVTSVNEELGEFGGVFVQKQPSDTDLGSKVPKDPKAYQANKGIQEPKGIQEHKGLKGLQDKMELMELMGLMGLMGLMV